MYVRGDHSYSYTRAYTKDFDALPVLDDVGGVSGYCDMLLGLHGKNGEGSPFDNPEETKDWAAGMGWTGRMNKAEKIL